MSEEPSKLGTGLAWVGLILMTTLVMIRTMVEHDAFPMWVSDPFVFSPPVIGLTPTKALLLNLGIVLSCCMVLIGLFLRKEHFGAIAAILMTLGVTVIGYHGFSTFESVAQGSNLLAIVAVLYVASCAHKVDGAQQLIGAITLGFVMLLVVMGAYEMFVIHPNTIANYELTRDSFLAARGWTPGSFEALAYERRLHQAEPIAWFGLTNVFASFAGACGAGLLILGWSLRKTDRISIVYLLGGLVALAGLLMTGAKGGIGAFGLGIGLTAAAMLFKRKKLDGRAIAAMCGLMVFGVITRGFIGERIGELSLLFRSQYMVGSMRMFFEHPIVGVGPGAFQDTYAIVKPALSPEDVASAHSFGFDLIAMLGIGGLALIGVFVSILSRIRLHTDTDTTASIINHRQLTQISLLIIAIASVISIRFGSLAMDTTLLIVQVLGSCAWAWIAYLIVKRDGLGESLRWALFASAGVLAIHSMIEVTGTWMVSGMLWALMIGSACTRTDVPSSSKPKPVVLLVIASLLGGCLVFGLGIKTTSQWEHELELASESAENISNLRFQLDELEYSTTPTHLREQIAQQLSEIAGYQVSSSIDQIVSELNRAEFFARQSASEHLIEAAQIRPTHMPTSIAASQQILWRASVVDSIGQHDQAVKLWDQALELLESGVSHSTGAGGYQWLGSVYYGRAMQFPDDPAGDSWLEHAQFAWERAFERSPHNPHLALKLMDGAIEQGALDKAGEWADEALRLHEQSRLDPLRGLGESDLMRVRVIVRSHPDPDGP